MISSPITSGRSTIPGGMPLDREASIGRHSRIRFAVSQVHPCSNSRWPTATTRRQRPLCSARVAILAALLLPVLSKAKVKAQGIYCLNNLKQLQLAVIIYSDDNQDKFPENPGLANGPPAWVHGQMTWDTTAQANVQNTNAMLMTSGEIGPYLAQNAQAYKCPQPTLSLAPGGYESAATR
jgi:hypothetical protein